MQGRPVAARTTVAVLLALAHACQAPLETASLPLTHRFEARVEIASAAARCVLDTGSGLSLIAAGFADRAGLADAPTPDPEGVPVGDGIDTSRIHRMVMLTGLRLGSNEFAAFPVPVLPASASHFPADGILGIDVLQSAAWIFDAPAGRAICVDPARLAGELEARRLAVVSRLPFAVRARHLFLSVRLEDSRDVEMLLDTGAAKTTLSPDTTAALGLRSGAELERREREQLAARVRAELERHGLTAVEVDVGAADETPFVGILGRAVPHRPFWLQRLDLGAVTLRDLCVYSADIARDVLGADALARVVWSFDPVRREVCILAGSTDP